MTLCASHPPVACNFGSMNIDENPKADQSRPRINYIQISDSSKSDLISRRGSNQSHYDLQDRLDSEGVSLQTLFDLKALLDTECFIFTMQDHPVMDPTFCNQKLTRIAVRLSEPLALCHDQEISVFLEIQLRTLIAAFALLHFRGVTKLPSQIYDDLRFRKLGSLYSTVCQQKKDGGNPITATNVYLIQLALQYLSLFGCFRNRGYESTKPVVEIVFATLMMPAQQYQQSLNIITGIQELARIWRKKEPKQHPICAVQEHIRQLTIAYNGEHSHGSLGARVEKMLTNTLGQIEDIFALEVEKNPDTLRNWHTTRNAFQLGPPEINSRYYLFGLLDCMAQLAFHVSFQASSSNLFGMLRNFVFKTSVQEFRWKAIEALLSFRQTRSEIKSKLLRSVESDWTLSTTQKRNLTYDIETVNSTLQAGENGTITRRASEPVSSHLSIFQNDPELLSTAEPPKLVSPKDSIAEDITVRGSKEKLCESPWKESQLQQFACSGALNLIDLSAALKKFGPKASQVVGFSNNARSIFFLSDQAISIFDLARQGREPIVFKQDKKEPSRIKIGALTENFLVFVKSRNSVSTVVVKRLLDQVTEIEWSLKGGQIRVAVAEESPHSLLILIAQGNGQVCIYKLDKTKTPWRTDFPFCRLHVDRDDYVKQISISPTYDSIAALTHRNVLWVWPTGPDFTNLVDPFRYSHGYYNPDKGDNSLQPTGLTSASIYSPPDSRNTYTFCTSFASRTRCNSRGNWDVNGEWSYITPNTISGLPDEYPSPRQNLMQFADAHALTTGVVSSTANVFAVLEKPCGEQRRVLWMPIQAHETGGVECPKSKPSALEFLMEGKDQTDNPGQGSCALRFREHDGRTWLVAADIKGRVWEVSFERV